MDVCIPLTISKPEDKPSWPRAGRPRSGRPRQGSGWGLGARVGGRAELGEGLSAPSRVLLAGGGRELRGRQEPGRAVLPPPRDRPPPSALRRAPRFVRAPGVWPEGGKANRLQWRSRFLALEFWMEGSRLGREGRQGQAQRRGGDGCSRRGASPSQCQGALDRSRGLGRPRRESWALATWCAAPWQERGAGRAARPTPHRGWAAPGSVPGGSRLHSPPVPPIPLKLELRLAGDPVPCPARVEKEKKKAGAVGRSVWRQKASALGLSQA